MQPVILFITGVSGFIGSHLTERLLRENAERLIVGIDNMNDYYDVSLKEYRLNRLSEYKTSGLFKVIYRTRI